MELLKDIAITALSVLVAIVVIYLAVKLLGKVLKSVIVVLCVIAILFAGDSTNLIKDITNCINLKKVINTLHYTSQSLKTHTGINVFIFKLSVITLTITVKL